MQPTPEKTVANLNEYYGKRPPISLPKGVIELETIPTLTPEQDEVVNTGVSLVERKVNSILGSNNLLTRPNLAMPTIQFVDADLDYPHWAGYFDSDKNTITIVTGQIPSGSRGQTKVFIHEYLHFLSHNGRNYDEAVRADSPIAQQNNVGFRRHFGLDIRKGKENQLTSSYFLAFNEAVTEQLAIDIFLVCMKPTKTIATY
ncbi:hypothetical protein IPL68_05365 [Candidatus Saccharibacteria bacterium]|nr:MAG: hypothetical protein IPL68_05365 [Candidatus Saccharibacteria bacterium]